MCELLIFVGQAGSPRLLEEMLSFPFFGFHGCTNTFADRRQAERYPTRPDASTYEHDSGNQVYAFPYPLCLVRLPPTLSTLYCRDTRQPPASWSLGAVLGPGLGGILAEPAEHHPQTFSEDGVFGRCLPCYRPDPSDRLVIAAPSKQRPRHGTFAVLPPYDRFFVLDTE